MGKKRTWTTQQLLDAVKNSKSKRQVLAKLNLREAGGNYDQLGKYIRELNIDISHFTGRGWSKGLRGIGAPRYSLEEILTANSTYQSFKLKKRLFQAKIKEAKCELCGWAQRALDGRLPLELDHINGNRHDNRLENIRILCPNCHSLQSTHRGKNRSKTLKKVFV